MGINSNQAKPRGTLKILWEGLKLPYNNLALLHPILLLSFLSSSLVFLASNLCLTPLLLDLTTKSSLAANTDPESPEFSLLLTAVLKDLKEVRLVEAVVLVISFVVKSLVATATVDVLSTAYSSKTPSSNLKEVFSTLSWPLIKRCMITQVYAALVNLGCILVVGLTAVVLSFSFTYYYYSSSSRSYAALMVILAIVAAVLEFYLYFYLLMVVNTSVVVSVVEEGCYGLEAIAKASKLLRGGRRQAIRIALLELAVAEVFYGVYKLGTARAAPVGTARLALGFGQVAVGVVVSVLTWSVQTVYYYECSAGHAEEGIVTEGGFEYNPLPTQVNEALL
ncbi:uncharacterized protein M6B38_284890 [Iris pallida]|uniref:Transmembrane protein n=1 Tax=Iris pallida TaxID=29817 RepID=A0AAX6I2D2_IRIPA|nr:uncharacterized protein M6B38_284890 [Iris pallida]